MKRYLAVVGGIAAAAVLIYFFFAPVFSGNLILRPSITVGDFELRYYGLILGLAVLTSYFVARTNSWRFGLGEKEIDRYVFWLVIFALIGARLYFVLFEYNYFSAAPSEIIQIWNGGLSIFGAILGGLLFSYIYARNKIYTAWQLLDVAALVLPIGQAIGRFGNFINYEAYGPVTDLPWKMFVPQEHAFVHPTFLYEALGSVLLFLILFKYRGKLKAGNLALCYLAGYGAIRFLTEFFRTDSVYVLNLRADQIIAAAIILLAALILALRNRSKQNLEI